MYCENIQLLPVFNKRFYESLLHNFCENFRLDFYKERIDFKIQKGEVVSIMKNSNKDCNASFYISYEMFQALCFGHRSWHDIQYIHPDVFPFSQYVNPVANKTEDLSGLIMDCIFPKSKSWIYLQY
jgi:hypothetical protein